RNPKQERTHARVPAHAIACRDTPGEGPLDEILDLLGRDLVGKEPTDRLEVAQEQLVAGRAIAGLPALEQFVVGPRAHSPRSIPCLAWPAAQQPARWVARLTSARRNGAAAIATPHLTALARGQENR